MNPLPPDPMQDLIVRSLAGETSAQEESQLQAWLAQAQANRELYAEYQKVWQGLDKVADAQWVDAEADWKSLEGKLDSPLLLDNNPEQAKAPAKANAAYFSWKVAAAVALLLLSALALLLLQGNDYQTLATHASQVESLQLADGTTVTLNASSELLYPEDFDGPQRNVRLEGEAFFEVAHNPQKPFVVAVNAYEVKVLGTSFNIATQSQGAQLRVMVRSGRVAVYPQGREAEALVLTAGQAAVLTTGQQLLEVEESPDQNLLAWKTRHLQFEDAELQQVVEALNRAYHSQIKLESPGLGRCPITVAFSGQSLEAVLRVLESTLNLEVVQQNDTILIRGEGC